MRDTSTSTIQVTRINHGLEFGHGTISGHDKAAILELVDETIKSNSAILVSIDTDDDGTIIDDDGCGDGRGVLTVFSGNKKFKRSLNRAKIFGGAVTMTLATQVGLGIAATSSLNAAFDDAIDLLIDEDIDFGAHTDEHAHGSKCGCGAIDQAPNILLAALKYEQPIRGVIAFLGVPTEGIDEVYRNYRAYVSDSLPYQSEYSGKQVMNRIITEAKVVKQLGGEHREKRIVLNLVRDYTVNQKLIREVSDGAAQIFAVDVWRLEDIAHDLYKGEIHKQKLALLSELVYTLATAAVLTKGDLPVYTITPQKAVLTV
jgi:hypothetical protein